MLTTQQMALLVVVLILSVFAGLAVYLQNRRENKFPSSVLHLFGEISNSAVAGMSVFYIGEWQGYSEPLTCLGALIAAYNGKMYLDLLTQKAKDKFKLGNK